MHIKPLFVKSFEHIYTQHLDHRSNRRNDEKFIDGVAEALVPMSCCSEYAYAVGARYGHDVVVAAAEAPVDAAAAQDEAAAVAVA